MKKNYIIILVILALATISFFYINEVKAVEIGAGNFKMNIKDPEVPYTKLDEGITTIVNAIITVAQIAFIILFLIGGVMYLTSMGNEEQAGKARKLLLEAIVGLVIVLAAWAVSNWIITALKDKDASVNTLGTSSGAPSGGGGTGTYTNISPNNGSLPIPNQGNNGNNGNNSSAYDECMEDCYVVYMEDRSGCDVQSCRDEADADYSNCKSECANGPLSEI